MRIGVLGAGALGCVYGAFLSQKNDVVMITTSDEKAEIFKKQGIELENDKGIRVFKVDAVKNGTKTEPFDILIVLVKGMQTETAIKTALPMIGGNTLVLSLQNGMGNEEILAKYVNTDNLLQGVARFNSVLKGVGRIYQGAEGVTNIGSQTASLDKAELIAKVFTESGLSATATKDIRRTIWSKLFANATMNPLTFIFGCRNGFLGENENAWALLEALVREMVAVANGGGYDFDAEKILENMKVSCKTYGSGMTSMAQDRIKKAVTEVDYINGSIVREGKRVGVPTPYHEAIVNIVHGMEALY